MIASGFAYNGEKNQEKKWKGVLAVDPKLELTASPKDKAEYWNASINLWLKNYIYLRYYTAEEIKASPSKANTAQHVTSLVSAMWHGFYPGYYFAFFQASFIFLLTKYLYKWSINYEN